MYMYLSCESIPRLLMNYIAFMQTGSEYKAFNMSFKIYYEKKLHILIYNAELRKHPRLLDLMYNTVVWSSKYVTTSCKGIYATFTVCMIAVAFIFEHYCDVMWVRVHPANHAWDSRLVVFWCVSIPGTGSILRFNAEEYRHQYNARPRTVITKITQMNTQS